jgi:NitT/TauT family transport system substrate-binding protein
MNPSLRLVAASLSLALATTLAACGSDSDHASAGAGGLVKVNFRTDYLASGSYAAITYGIDHGIYREHGIDLDMRHGTGSPATATDVSSGRSQFGIVGGNVVASSVSDGADLIGIGVRFAKSPNSFYVDENSPIRTLADLKGKTVVVSSGTNTTAMLPALWALGGITGQVELLSVAPNVAVSTFASGKGDAFAAPWPSWSNLVTPTRKSRPLFWSDLGLKEMPAYFFVARSSYVREHPDIVAGFLKATYESMAEAAANPEAAEGAYAKANPQLRPADVKSSFKDLLPYTCSQEQVDAKEPVGYPDPGQVAEGIKVLRRYGGLSGAVTAEKVATDRFFKPPYNVSGQTCTGAGR